MHKYFLSALAALAFVPLANAATVADAAADQQSAFTLHLNETANAFGIQLNDNNSSTGDSAGQDNGGKGHQPPEACTKINLTDDQKATIKASMLQHMKDMVQLQANVKLAFLDYVTVVRDANGTADAANAASGKIIDAKSALGANHAAFGNNILFTVMTADQRQFAWDCMSAMRRGHRGHHPKL